MRKIGAKASAVGLLCLVPWVNALAQPVAAQERPAAAADRNINPIRVEISINFFVPGSTNESAESAALRDRARRSVYEMAARECELLRDRLADDCRLENVSVNINRQTSQQNGQQVEGFQVGGTLGFRITQK